MISGILQKCIFFDSIHVFSVSSRLLFHKTDIVIQIKCHQRKNLSSWRGKHSSHLQNGPRPKANEGNEDSTQAKSAKTEEQRFFEPWLKTYSWPVYEKNGNYMYWKVCSEARKSNG